MIEVFLVMLLVRIGFLFLILTVGNLMILSFRRGIFGGANGLKYGRPKKL